MKAPLTTRSRRVQHCPQNTATVHCASIATSHSTRNRSNSNKPLKDGNDLSGSQNTSALDTCDAYIQPRRLREVLNPWIEDLCAAGAPMGTLLTADTLYLGGHPLQKTPAGTDNDYTPRDKSRFRFRGVQSYSCGNCFAALICRTATFTTRPNELSL